MSQIQIWKSCLVFFLLSSCKTLSASDIYIFISKMPTTKVDLKEIQIKYALLYADILQKCNWIGIQFLSIQLIPNANNSKQLYFLFRIYFFFYNKLDVVYNITISSKESYLESRERKQIWFWVRRTAGAWAFVPSPEPIFFRLKSFPDFFFTSSSYSFCRSSVQFQTGVVNSGSEQIHAVARWLE